MQDGGIDYYCHQAGVGLQFNFSGETTEDCLFLDVTVPRAVLEGRAGRVPVLFWWAITHSPGAISPTPTINLLEVNGVIGSMAAATQRVRKRVSENPDSCSQSPLDQWSTCSLTTALVHSVS